MRRREYAVVTFGYWAFTLTDGALRMLVLLYFHDLGYSPVAIAFLFLAYELMGVITNLLGGWVGARGGLHRTLLAGLALQAVALGALTLHNDQWSEVASVIFVMGLQALSGVAKDLTKMSSKSAVKFVAGAGEGMLFRLVAMLTGSKNALKGVGFFVGAALLSAWGFDVALWSLAALVTVAFAVAPALLRGGLEGDRPEGRAGAQKQRALFATSPAINRLSLARVFLFGSRDIWFVVALPVFLDEVLGWSFTQTGGFLAAWVIGYGVVQAVAPRLVGAQPQRSAAPWAGALVAVALAIAAGISIGQSISIVVIAGLVVFGIVFAVNSSLHSFLVLAFTDDVNVALDVGFYYSANALGRLVGTLLSGLLYLWGGLELAMWGSVIFLAITWGLSRGLVAFATDGQPGHAPRPADLARYGPS